ncbi:MAG: type II toxin-antitoxin system Phd/YefM family antitoxin [Candidatus Sulfotelmatobacter sp.]|jgi:prevent-host-death family protein
MPAKLTASLARQNFSDILSRAEYRGERVIVHRGKKAVAAVVPIEDVELLESLEDEIDMAAAREALTKRSAHDSLGEDEELRKTSSCRIGGGCGPYDSVQASGASPTGKTPARSAATIVRQD